MFLGKKYFYIILILLAIPLLGLAAPINSKYTFEILDPSVDTTFVTGGPLLVSWQIKGSGTTLETLVNQNRIARIYLKQKTGKLDRVLKTVGAVALSNDMIECSDEQEMNCTLTQEYEWSKIPAFSSKSNYYIRITLRSKQNLGAFIKAFFLWSKYPFADSAIFNINSLVGIRLSDSSSISTSISNTTTTTVKNVADSIENLNPKSVEVLPIAPPKIEAPRSIIFANIDIPLDAKNYVKVNEDLYPPIYLTPEYYVDKTSTYNNTASRAQAIELVVQKGPYLATLYKIIAGENSQQYRQIKFYPDGKYEEIPTQWSVIDSKLVKYYSFLPINPNGISNKEALAYKVRLYNTMVNVLNAISSNISTSKEDGERLKISYNLRRDILTLMTNDREIDNFNCDINSIDSTTQKLEEARKRMSINCPNEDQCNQSSNCLYECKAFNNARNLLSEYKGLCTLMTNNNAYTELIRTVEDRAINYGYEKVTLLKRGNYSELLNSYITNDINILGKSITRCATDTNNKCWSSYSVWPSNFTVYPDNISGGVIPLPQLLIPTEYQFGDNELSKNIFPTTGTEYLTKEGSVTDRITQLSEKYGNLAEAIVYKNGWGFSPLPAPKGTIDSNGTYKAPAAFEDGIIINTLLAHSTEGDRRFNVYILPKDKLASDLLAPIFNKSFESGNPKYVLGNALHYCDSNINEYIGNTFGIEQASDYALYIKNKSDNITPTIVSYNDYSIGGTSRLILKWPVSQIGNLTIGSFSISNNLKTKTLEMFLDHCQKSGACPYSTN